MAASAALAAPELSVSTDLADRRYGVAGERARVIGFQDGRFYANGWHITGEMGGIWSEPIKLLDGVWFGVGDEWVGPATEFRSGFGYAELDLPAAAGLQVERTDFVPDGRRAALFGLTLTNGGAAPARSPSGSRPTPSCSASTPGGSTGSMPNAADNLEDTARSTAAPAHWSSATGTPGASERA